jgi:hypothetical protein
MANFKSELLVEKSKLEKMIAECSASDAAWELHRVAGLKANLAACEKKLKIIEDDAHQVVVDEMKYFVNLNRELDSKYSCRTVRALYAIAEWCEKPRSHSIATWCRDFAMKKIHAPVCSIGKPPAAKYKKPEIIGTISDREKDALIARDIIDIVAKG